MIYSFFFFLLSSSWVSFWIVSITMPSSSLVFSSDMPNMLIILSSVFFYLIYCSLHLWKFYLGPFLYLSCLNFLNIWNTVMHLMILSANPNICVSSRRSAVFNTVQLCQLLLFSTRWLIFSCLFVLLDTSLLDVRHSDFYFLGWWIFLPFYKYSWALF